MGGSDASPGKPLNPPMETSVAWQIRVTMVQYVVQYFITTNLLIFFTCHWTSAQATGQKVSSSACGHSVEHCENQILLTRQCNLKR